VTDATISEKEETLKDTENVSQDKEQLELDNTSCQMGMDIGELKEKGCVTEDNTSKGEMTLEIMSNETEQINEAIVNDTESQEIDKDLKKSEDELQNKEQLKEDKSDCVIDENFKNAVKGIESETKEQTIIHIDSNEEISTENKSDMVKEKDVEQNESKVNEKNENGLIQEKGKPSDGNEPTEIIRNDSKHTETNSEKEENINLDANENKPENIENSHLKIEDQKIITKPGKKSASKPEKKTKKEKKSKTIHDEAVLSVTNFSEKQKETMHEKVDKDICDEKMIDPSSENNIVASKEETKNAIPTETNILEEEQCHRQLDEGANEYLSTTDKPTKDKKSAEENITTWENKDPVSLEITENMDRNDNNDNNASFIPNKSMQNEIKEAIREIENMMEKEDVCNLPPNMDHQQKYGNDLQSKEEKEKKTTPKLTRKGSTKYQRRADNRQGSNTSGKTFHIRKLSVNEMMTTSTPVSESDVHKSPYENLDTILSNITITYQELGYFGSNSRKTEKIKILKQKMANEKSLKDKF